MDRINVRRTHHGPEYSHCAAGTANEAPPREQRDSPLPPRAAYNLWAPTYGTTGRNPLSAAAASALLTVLPVLAGRRVLDIACGDGRWARFAQANGATWVAGVDFSAGMLASAQAEMRAAAQAAEGGMAVATADSIVLAAADMQVLPFPTASFEVAIHALALGHVPDPAPAIRAAAAVLAPGGVLALVDLHPDAAARGWRRTFRDAGGQQREVCWHPHTLSTVMAACECAGLAVERLVERPLDPDSLPPDAPTEATGGLAVYALAAVRRPRRPG